MKKLFEIITLASLISALMPLIISVKAAQKVDNHIVSGYTNLASQYGIISGYTTFQDDPTQSQYNPPQHAIDDNLTTRWVAEGYKLGGVSHFIEVDLGEERVVNAIQIQAFDNRVYRFKVQTRLEGAQYDDNVLAVDARNNADGLSPISYLLDAPITARYVKLTIIEEGGVTHWGINILEFKILQGTGQSNNEIGIYAEEYQEIMGWGGFPCYNRTDWDPNNLVFAPPTEQLRPGVYDALFSELGMTFFRIDYQPRFYINEPDDGTLRTEAIDDVLTTVKAAADRGLTDYLVSIWTPPLPMKNVKTRNGYFMRDGKRYNSSLLESREADFVQYVCDVTNYIKTKGETEGYKPPKYISLQNEPIYTVDYDSAYGTPEQYIRVLKMLRKALDDNGLQEVMLMAGDGNNFDYNNVIFKDNYQRIHLDQEAYDATAAIGVHAYAGNSYQWNRNLISREVFQTFDLPLLQSEWCPDSTSGIGGGSDIDYAIHTARRFSKDMVEIGYNYWLWWMMYTYQSGRTSLIYGGNPETSYEKNRNYEIFSAIWNNATPGSRVKRLYTTDASLRSRDNMMIDMAGFVNHEDDKTVLLITNPTQDGKNMDIKYLGGTEADVYQWDEVNRYESGGLKTQGAQISQATMSVYLPSKSVTVIVSNSATLSDQAPQPPDTPETTKASPSANPFTVEHVYRSMQAQPLVDAITIDGNLEDFGQTLISLGKTVNGNTVATAQFNAKYDSDALYVGVSVTDPNVVAGDHVNIYLDGHNNKNSSIDGNDKTVTINAIGTSDVECQYGVRTTAQGYDVEVKIPWTLLDTSPSERTTIGLDVEVIDQGSYGKLLWSGGANNYRWTEFYGDCVLVGDIGVRVETQKDIFLDDFDGGITQTSVGSTIRLDEDARVEGTASMSVEVTVPSGTQREHLVFHQPMNIPIPNRDKMSLDFWLRCAAPFNLLVGLISENEGAEVTSYVNLRRYITPNQWGKVSIPISLFDSYGLIPDNKDNHPANNGSGSSNPNDSNPNDDDPGEIDWSNIIGLEFRCDNTGELFYRIDQLQINPISYVDTPGMLRTSSTTREGLGLSWIAPQSTAKTVLYRNQQVIAELDSNITSYMDKGLTEGRKYLYHLVGVDQEGNQSDISYPLLVTAHEMDPYEPGEPLEPETTEYSYDEQEKIFTVTVKRNNPDGKDSEERLLIAANFEEGRLINVNGQSMTLQIDPITTQWSCQLEQVETDHTVKVMLWDDFENMGAIDSVRILEYNEDRGEWLEE